MQKSKFYGSDSDTTSDESVDEAPQPAKVQPKWASSDDEDEKRVVKSKDEKFQDEVLEVVLKLKNKRKNNDWAKVEEAFDELCKVLKSQKRVDNPPRIFLKCYADLEDAVEQTWPNKKDLNKLAAKAISTLRQKLRKMKQESNIESRLTGYRANPDNSGDEAAKPEAVAIPAAVSAASSVSEKAPTLKRPVAAAAAPKDDDDDDSEISWGSGETSSESDDDAPAGTCAYTAVQFLKKPKGKESKKEDQHVKPASRPKVVQEDSVSEDDGFEPALPVRIKKSEKPLFAKDEEIKESSVLAKLTEILASRGRKGTSGADQMTLLRRLLQETSRVKLPLALQVKIYLQIVAAHFDDPNSVSSHMNAIEWHACHDDIMELLVHLLNDGTIRCVSHVGDDAENLSNPVKPYVVAGSVLAFVERLDEEYIKALQSADPHATEYVDRLKDEGVIYNLICVCEKYLRAIGSKDELSSCIIRRVEHTYYKRVYLACPVRHRPSAIIGDDGSVMEAPDVSERLYLLAVDPAEEADIPSLMARLCKSLYTADGGDRNRTRAMLCHVYHLGIFDRWFQARDLMLMSHLQDSIIHADASTQILYNRTMVQLGLCAFRAGMISTAHSALHDIWAGGRVKELLAQGLAQRKQQEKTSDELKNEKKRQIPFHMHINIELLECVYYVTSMLLEVPHMAESVEVSSRVISKPFRRQLDYFTRQVFNGPPENARDHVMAGAIAMKSGDWRTCESHVLTLGIWALCPNTEIVKAMLRQKIKEEGLRTYLFAFSGFYDSISLATLSEMFKLSVAAVHSIISKMIINEELQASHDQPTCTIVIHKAEASPLQTLALTLADKVGQFVESNERLLDAPTSSGFKDRQTWQSRPQRRDGQGFGGNRVVRPAFRTQGRSLREQQFAAVDAANAAAAAATSGPAPASRTQWK